MLKRFYNDSTAYELCIDEVGRGCLFGRAYIACVVLPKDPGSFDGTDVKDSKKFSSRKKLGRVADRIQNEAFAYHIAFVEHSVIDEVNILQGVMQGMHECIRECLAQIEGKIGRQLEWSTGQETSRVPYPLELSNGQGTVQETSRVPCPLDWSNDVSAIIDGNYFKPYRSCTGGVFTELPFATVEKGDATYMGIAAASILAKHARDSYITELCTEYPALVDRYGLDTNMGYGTAKHLAGIREHGITQWHRRSFGDACRVAALNPV